MTKAGLDTELNAEWMNTGVEMVGKRVPRYGGGSVNQSRVGGFSVQSMSRLTTPTAYRLPYPTGYSYSYSYSYLYSYSSRAALCGAATLRYWPDVVLVPVPEVPIEAPTPDPDPDTEAPVPSPDTPDKGYPPMTPRSSPRQRRRGRNDLWKR
ncbi:hypothetical protein PNOK_0525700 [Pyrrhoderma noxium]|uniref:Uncharacterized protein n=1 Tax=Pyrrhoderma noxium TaxID=2282107 RepID=A0A286UG20_9AGAM|nr:hypothetical protein PNOK_0525700 [Pyrrhoderma noxium]